MISPFGPLPEVAAFEHREARAGFEIAFFRAAPDGLGIDGSTSAVEDGEAFTVTYDIELDATWRTRRAIVTGRSRSSCRERLLEADSHGGWCVDGAPDPALSGCLDVDLESSSLTNALPVHRLGLGVGDAAQVPAAYVRALDLTVERLEQRYERLDCSQDGHHLYAYEAPAFSFACVLEYDDAGLVMAYPGIARRAAVR